MIRKQKQKRAPSRLMLKMRVYLQAHKLHQFQSQYTRLVKKYNKYLSLHTSPRKKTFFGNKEMQEVEYNKSLLMPYYLPEVVERIAFKKSTPLIDNNLAGKRHKYGEDKEKEYKYRLAVIEVMEDVCRINNWTSKSDWKEKNVPVADNFRKLFKSAIDYSDILKYYTKSRFDERRNRVH
jgi:hypothetical protein